MRRASIVLAALSLASLFLQAGSQPVQATPRPQLTRFTDDPAFNGPATRPFRPKLALQDALKIAERYIDEQRIDISPFWLSSAKFILVGDERTPAEKRIPCWHFVWVNENGFLGDYVEIVVTMDGHASRAPSM